MTLEISKDVEEMVREWADARCQEVGLFVEEVLLNAVKGREDANLPV